MERISQALISQQELALRWRRSPTAIGLASALGVGPKHLKVDGALRYSLEEVEKYEQIFHFSGVQEQHTASHP